MSAPPRAAGIDAGRRADLLWHGEALAELRKLAARSGALTDDERAFAGAADRAARRSRRLRRALIVGAIGVARGGRDRDASLSIAANKSRSAAETSAGEARDAAKLAEDRLTAGLIAQGRRELNDNRGVAALAYFAEALRRGADTPGLRTMIAIAERGERDEELVLHDYKAMAITTLPTGFAVGDSAGKLHLFDASAKPAGELPLELEDVYIVRARGTRLAGRRSHGRGARRSRAAEGDRADPDEDPDPPQPIPAPATTS